MKDIRDGLAGGNVNDGPDGPDGGPDDGPNRPDNDMSNLETEEDAAKRIADFNK